MSEILYFPFCLVGKDIELVTSPTATCIIKGDLNVLRYISKRFGLLTCGLGGNSSQVANQEEMMDMLYVEKYWGSGSENSTTKIASLIEPFLNQSQYLTSAELSLVDIYAYSLLVKEKGKCLSPKLQDWMKRCGGELKLKKGN